MKPVKPLTILMACVLFSVPAYARNDNPEREIRATIARMERALNGSNIQTLKSVYAEDAVLVPAEAEVLSDKQAIVSFWNHQFNNARSRYHINVIHYRVGHNTAHLSALWSATIITPDIQAEVKYGYLTNVLKRQADGSWKIQEQNWD